MRAPSPVVFLIGPTASGKSALSLPLAEALGAEIVSVDSAQCYRGMDVGTAKPSIAERARVPHHLIDVVEPDDPYSAARFVGDALEAIRDVRSRGRRPLLTGGTVLYFNALQHGLAPMPAADPELRAALAEELAADGPAALHAELARVDPVAAARIHPRDPQRVQRALEVFRACGTPLSELQRRTRPALAEPVVKLALVPTERAWLHARIRTRFAAMLERGLLDEVRALRARPGVHAGLPSMRAVGYRQAWEHLDAPGRDASDGAGAAARHGAAGAGAEDTWVGRAVAATRQLAKRQLTWLRGMGDAGTLACDDLGAGALLDGALRLVRDGERAARAAGSRPEPHDP